MERLRQILDKSIALLLLLFALIQPVSIAGAFIAYSAAALVWLVRLALGRIGMLHRSPLDLPILVYWLLCALSTLVAPLPASAWEGMRKVNLLFVAILVAQNVLSLRRVRQLVGTLLLASFVSVLYAGLQMVAGVGLRVDEVTPGSAFFQSGIRDNDVILRVDGHLIRSAREFLSYLDSNAENKPVRLLIVHDSGFDVLKDAVPVIVPVGALPRARTPANLGMKVATERLSRARAFYSHPVTYAMVLESLACLVFGVWLALRNHSRATTRLGLLGLWLVFSLGLGATLTRSAWMAFAFGCLLIIWVHARRRWIKVALPVLLLFASLGTNAAARRWRGVGLIDMHDPGTQYRVLMWRDGLRLIRAHPWFGVGMNTIRDEWWEFDLAAYSKYHLRSHFHSTPIQLAVTQGIPVLLAWCVLMGCYLLMLLRLVNKARERQDFQIYALALGIFGATGAFLVSSLVQNNFGDSVVVLQFWFLVGIALALQRQLQSNVSGADSPAPCSNGPLDANRP